MARQAVASEGGDARRKHRGQEGDHNGCSESACCDAVKTGCRTITFRRFEYAYSVDLRNFHSDGSYGDEAQLVSCGQFRRGVSRRYASSLALHKNRLLSNRSLP